MRNRLRIPGVLSLMLAVLGAGTAPVVLSAQQNTPPMPEFEFRAGETLRDLVALHLNDPDLWPVVLSINEIASPAEVVPGTRLRMPVEQVRAADVALQSALDAIQRANAEGAQIFAPVEIEQAIDNRENAVLQRAAGGWGEVVSLSDIATGLAFEALAISEAQRNRSAEAVVSDVQGDVEGRAPAEPRWTGRQLHDILVEFERMRTLSDSTSQITFRDLSRLRLNANSNATIQRMRSDPLTGGEVTKVSLANGDFYALLNQLSDNTSFEIEVPGVKTTTESTDFWIKNDQRGARFVNYDGPDLEVRQGDETIMVSANEGVVLAATGASRADVLGPVALSEPPPDATAFAGEARLSWQALPGARTYWLEVARDPGFNQMQVSEWAIGATGFAASGLEPGEYHWRVAAIDGLGLPGSWSRPRVFSMRIDETPPYLAMLSPVAGSLQTTAEAEVLGVTEADAVVQVNGVALQPAADGSFSSLLMLIPGENTITLHATDPAGNRTTRTVTVVFRPDVNVEIRLSDGIPRADGALATRSDQLSVRGQSTAQPGAEVVVSGPDGVAARSRVGPAGEIGFSVPVTVSPTDFLVEILSPTGAVEGSTEFRGVSDRVAPELELDLPPPQATGDDLLLLEGSAGDAARLTLNDAPLALESGRFVLEAELEPGANTFELVAEDAAGNLRVLRFDTLLDIDPPEILEVELGRPDGAEGPIRLQVQARDASGLRQAASYLIRVGAVEREGFLRCDSAQGTCSATLPAEPGQLDLIELAIEDYAGNTAFE